MQHFLYIICQDFCINITVKKVIILLDEYDTPMQEAFCRWILGATCDIHKKSV